MWFAPGYGYGALPSLATTPPLATSWLCTVRVFRQNFALEDAIGSHACSLEVNMRVTDGIPLRVNCTYRGHHKLRLNSEGTT